MNADVGLRWSTARARAELTGFQNLVDNFIYITPTAQTQNGPEAGRNAGGTVNVVTRSGGNELHGSVYYYNRNEFYAAHTPFLPAGTKAPPLRNENYGASLGGPILKDKLFYFANYEKQDFIIGLSGVATEPSNAWVANAGAVLAANSVPVPNDVIAALNSVMASLARAAH